MHEKITNFSELVEKYFKEQGKDVAFHFLHMIVNYTYIDLHHQYIDGNDNWKKKERVERIKDRQTIFIPVIIEKSIYQEKYQDKIYDYDIRPIEINNIIDIGDSDNLIIPNEVITSNIPNECTIISSDDLTKIAFLNNYDRFEWHIYDAALNKPPVAYCGPEWNYDIYGIKKYKYSK